MSLRKTPTAENNDFTNDSPKESSRLLRRPPSGTLANIKSTPASQTAPPVPQKSAPPKPMLVAQQPAPPPASITLKTQTSIPQLVVPEVARAQERTVEQTPKIVRAQRRAKSTPDASLFQGNQAPSVSTQPSLSLWESRGLAHSPHPIARALRILFEAHALSALVLKDDTQRQDIKSFLFTTKYCVKPGARIGIWSGLTWRTDTSPLLWNSLLHDGWIEIPPYRVEGSETKSTELLIVRKIFGLEDESNETLTLIFSDPVVVAVFSRQSLESVKTPFREELHSAHEATGMVKALAA